MVSTPSSFFNSAGQEGLDAIHGSISTTFPVGVVMRKAAWPSHVKELPRVRNIAELLLILPGGSAPATPRVTPRPWCSLAAPAPTGPESYRSDVTGRVSMPRTCLTPAFDDIRIPFAALSNLVR